MSANPVKEAAGQYALKLDEAVQAGERLAEVMRGYDCEHPSLFCKVNYVMSHTAEFIREVLLRMAGEEAKHEMETGCDGC